MTDLLLDEFIPLTRYYVSRFAHPGPGVIHVTVRLANDAHHTVLHQLTGNMRTCLGGILNGQDPSLTELLDRYPCFFAVRNLSTTDGHDLSTVFGSLRDHEN